RAVVVVLAAVRGGRATQHLHHVVVLATLGQVPQAVSDATTEAGGVNPHGASADAHGDLMHALGGTHLHGSVGVCLVHQWGAAPRVHIAQPHAANLVAVVVQGGLALLAPLLGVLAPAAPHHDARIHAVHHRRVLTKAGHVNAQLRPPLAIRHHDGVHGGV